jgi:hypothetical protein
MVRFLNDWAAIMMVIMSETKAPLPCEADSVFVAEPGLISTRSGFMMAC